MACFDVTCFETNTTLKRNPERYNEYKNEMFTTQWALRITPTF